MPPTKTPDEPTEITTGLLFESVIVATEPGVAVDPFGSTTPDEPGTALIVSLPTVAMAVAEVGTRIVGVGGGRADGLPEGGGLPESGGVEETTGSEGGEVGAAAGGA